MCKTMVTKAPFPENENGALGKSLKELIELD
jgi:hypothetical protein